MYSSLDRVDIVAQVPSSGRRVLIQTDHRAPEECQATREISILFTLTKIIGARLGEPQSAVAPLVQYVAMHAPPDFLQQAIAAAGGQLVADEREVPYGGPRPAPAHLADQAFRDLATRLATERGEGLSETLLARLEEETLASRPDVEEDEEAYWTRVVELAAVTGELLRQATGGRWIVPTQRLSTLPFAFDLQDGRTANVAGKSERFLAHGERDSPRQFLRLVEGSKGTSSAAAPPAPVAAAGPASQHTPPLSPSPVHGAPAPPAYGPPPPSAAYGPPPPSPSATYRPPSAPGAPLTPGPLPPLPLDYSAPWALWIGRAAALLAESGVLKELAVEVQNARGSALLPALCEVGTETWAPYFEPGPWNNDAVFRLLQTLAVVRASPYAHVRFQIYGRFPPPPSLLAGLLGGEVPAPPPPGRVHPLLWVAAVVALVAVLRLFVSVTNQNPYAPSSSEPPSRAAATSPAPSPSTPAKATPSASPGAKTTPTPARPAAVAQHRPAPAAPRVSTQTRPRVPPQTRRVAAATPPVHVTYVQPAPMDDPGRLTPGQRAQMESLLRRNGVPRDFYPREVSAPGIEDAWTVSGFRDGCPTGLQSAFAVDEPVGIAVLLRRVRVDQRIDLSIYREGEQRALTQKYTTINRDDSVGYYTASFGFRAPGWYRVEIQLDSRLAKMLNFQVR